jgi:DNA-directed RNA polymerase alpha subunit
MCCAEVELHPWGIWHRWGVRWMAGRTDEQEKPSLLFPANPPRYSLLQDCNCDVYCPECSVTLKLSAKCTDNRTMEVTSKMLLIEGGERSGIGKPAVGENGDGILIAKLRKGQEIKMTCIAVKVRPSSLSPQLMLTSYERRGRDWSMPSGRLLQQ